MGRVSPIYWTLHIFWCILLLVACVQTVAGDQTTATDRLRVPEGDSFQNTSKSDDILLSTIEISTRDHRYTFPSTTDAIPLTLVTPNCQDVDEYRSAGEGVIELVETQDDCNSLWSWHIQTSSATDGIILHFHDVFLRYRSSLEVITFTDRSTTDTLRTFTYKDMSFYPLLHTGTSVSVILRMPYDSLKYQFITVNISYTAHPISKMPVPAFDPVMPSTGGVTFDCSGREVTVPKAFRCNGIRQCLLNEDEEGCEYTQRGCGVGWVPYQDQCLRMEFVTTFSFVPGRAHPTFPSEAERTCASMHGGTLAQLPDAEGVSLVGNMLRQSGMSSAVVGIKKVRPVSKTQRHLYRYMWQWGDKGGPLAYDQQQLQRDGPLEDCATLTSFPGIYFQPLRCTSPSWLPSGYVCMRSNPTRSNIEVENTTSVRFNPPTRRLDTIPTKECSDGSLVQTFHRCPSADSDLESGWSSNGFSLFRCRYGPPVHYSLVCDGRDECADGSDEMYCGTVTQSPLLESVFTCDSMQIIAKSRRCDGMLDCFDESDEVDCTACTPRNMILCTGVGCVPYRYSELIDSCPTLALFPAGDLRLFHPSVITFNGYGMSRMLKPNSNNTEGSFRCNHGDYIPSFLLNNGESDCRYGEDENIPVASLACPGFYSCQYTGTCVHPDFVCDGINHCPHKDDERYCDISCPDTCVCEGYAYACSQFYDPMGVLYARYLDLSGSANVSLGGLHFLEWLQFLNVSGCGLEDVFLKSMPQLRILDLSFNRVTNLSSFVFEGLPGLMYLNISGNPFIEVIDSTFGTFMKASGLVALRQLVITDSSIRFVEDRALSQLTQLVSLDIRRNPIVSYDKEIFWGLNSLQQLFTDDSKLCCSYFHSSLEECVAPVDELSSCSDLLRLDFFRVFLWTFSVFAIVGNFSVLLYRMITYRRASSASFHVLVCNLCGADFLMGVYMMIIGAADAKFRTVYVAKENAWKASWACNMAGFLGFLSSEVSALVICLITLDRLLVLCFPLKSQFHLQSRSSLLVCAVIWMFGLIIAVIPFLSGLEFYGETSICLPLPITRRDFSGQNYSFGIFIVFNFILFLFIGIGQAVIYRVVLNASTVAGSRRRQQEATIARRLFLVVFTDFCCWFPVGLMGLLAACDVPIPGEVNVWAAIFILPLNSALNPFLYTLNGAMEKWRTERLNRTTKRILGNLQVELPKLQPSFAEEVVRVCIKSRVVKKEKMLQWLQLRQDSTAIGSQQSEISSDRTSSFMLRAGKSGEQSSGPIVDD